MENNKENFTYKVEKELGILSRGKGGWKKELNMVSWSGRAPKLDIRDWSADRQKMSKGIALNEEEGRALLTLLSDLYRT